MRLRNRQPKKPNAADLNDKCVSSNPVHKIVHKDMEQYDPSVPHSRREHAPLRRYLPSELGLPEMYERFVDTGKMKMSYNTYLQGI